MDYEVFIERVMEAVKERLPEDADISLTNVQKNNGVVLKGVIFREQDCNTAPTIYLEGYYRMYLEGKDFETVIQELMRGYEYARQQGNFDLLCFTCFEKARHRILYKLVNYERNAALLEQLPHVRFLDLAVVFYYLVEKQQLGNTVIQIRNSHLEYWGVDSEEIYKWARINTPVLLPSEIMKMSELLREALDMEIPLEEEDPMYILSNSQRNQGACCMLYPDILRNFSNMIESDFYVLPSSVHEVILLPVCKEENPDRLQEMVKEVNESQVELEEQLSDRVYLYDREAQRLQICC